jgi:hypothetical protein
MAPSPDFSGGKVYIVAYVLLAPAAFFAFRR